MLVPKAPMEEFIKLGFKKCKRPYNECYYLCFAKGIQYIFLSPVMLNIVDWKDEDPRLHKHPNCKYRDNRTALEFIIELANKGMISCDYLEGENNGSRYK